MPTSTISSIDEEYQNAVTSGNHDLGEMLALQQASSQGFTVPAFHGTRARFNSFRPGDIGIHFSAERIAAERRIGDKIDDYDSDSRHEGVVYHVALMMKNPHVMNADLEDWIPSMFLDTAMLRVDNIPYISPSCVFLYEQRKVARASYGFLKRIGYSMDDIRRMYREFHDDSSDSDELNSFYIAEFRNRMHERGIDSIIYQNEYECVPGTDNCTCYMVLEPNQVKSIEPVYVDNLLISLSERFNVSSPFFRQ